MSPNTEAAYEIARHYGLSEDTAKKFKEWCEKEAYTLKHVKE